MAAPAFVGRQAELSQLRRLISCCHASSRPVLGLVRAETGLGKTSLLHAVCEPSPANLLWATGYELERHVPLGAASQLLRDLCLVEQEGSRLESLLVGAADRQVEPLQIFEAARRCIVELGPTMVLADDLQWLDDRTLALLHYLLREAAVSHHPLAVLAAARPGPVARAFEAAGRRLLNDPAHVLSVGLGPLDRADGVRLVANLRPGVAPEVAVGMWERTGGLPFWLAELARAEGSDQRVAGRLNTRLADLTVDAAKTAALLAVARAPTDPATIEAVLEWPTSRVQQAADELLECGLVTRRGTLVGIVHDLVRETIAAELSPALTRQLHAGLASQLERSAGNDTLRLRQALVHRRAAGLAATGLAQRIALSANRRLLNASDVADLALCADGRGPPDEEFALLWEVARLAEDLGRPDLALQRWEDLALRATDEDDRARAFLRASRAALESGDRPRSRSLLDDCIRTGRLSDVVQIEVDAHASELDGTSGPASELPMRRAVALAERLAQDRGVDHVSPEQRRAHLAALQAKFYFCLRTERPDAMLETAELIARMSDTVEGKLRAALDAVMALRLLGRYVEAEQRARLVRLAAAQGAMPAVSFLSGYLLAVTLHSLGRLEEARTAATDVAALADRAPVVLPSWLSVAWVKSLIPEIDASVVGWGGSRSGFERLIESESNPHHRLQILLSAAQWSARLSPDREQSITVSWLGSASTDTREAGCARCRSEFAVRAGEAYARIGRFVDARRLLDEWDAVHAQPAAQSRLWRLHAEALVVERDDPQGARVHLEEACRQADGMGAAIEQLWAQLDLGRILVATKRGDPDGVVVLKQAAETARRLGAESEERRAVQLMRAAGVRTWRPSRRPGPGAERLTEREVAIAQMVHAGASNPEIAEAMFLSRKTIERHVSNVLAKTATRNRAELAGKVAAGEITP